jgi:hypothetical protein
MSIIAIINDFRSKISELELSETLNTTIFNIVTHVTANNLLNTENTHAGDYIKVNGKIYIIISRIANYRVGFILS